MARLRARQEGYAAAGRPATNGAFAHQARDSSSPPHTHTTLWIAAPPWPGFDANLLSQTFSWATWGNGLVAILSGVAANIVADAFGLVAPFMLAIVTFVVGGVVIAVSWSENYGQQSVRCAAVVVGAGPVTEPRRSRDRAARTSNACLAHFPGGELAHLAFDRHCGLPPRYGSQHARLHATRQG